MSSRDLAISAGIGGGVGRWAPSALNPVVKEYFCKKLICFFQGPLKASRTIFISYIVDGDYVAIGSCVGIRSLDGLSNRVFSVSGTTQIPHDGVGVGGDSVSCLVAILVGPINGDVIRVGNYGYYILGGIRLSAILLNLLRPEVRSYTSELGQRQGDAEEGRNSQYLK